jgi:hypothetical protein
MLEVDGGPMRSLLLSLVLIAGSASPALACINDRDTDVSEREFNKRYEAEEAAPEEAPRPLRAIEASAGALLLVAGGVIAFRRLRPQG